MYWDDHSPPHFHAKYCDYEITVDILTGIVEGILNLFVISVFNNSE
jgi:hypothetical protein